MTGSVSILHDEGVALISFVDFESTNEVESIAHFFDLLRIGEMAAQVDEIEAVILGLNGQFDLRDFRSFARYSAAFFPHTLVSDDSFLIIGSFAVSLYCLDRLGTPWIAVESASAERDRSTVQELNAFLARTRSESSQRQKIAAEITMKAIDRLK